jgi:hypothetical protein
MDYLLNLPRYPFTLAAVEYAPEESGLFGLFDKNELIYLGRASKRESHTIRMLLLLHQDGAFGPCTVKASHYTWQITPWSTARETELLAQYLQVFRRYPRCNNNAAG